MVVVTVGVGRAAKAQGEEIGVQLPKAVGWFMANRNESGSD